MAKKGNLYGQINFVSRAKNKKTSIGRNPSTSMQNKSTRKSFKKYRGKVSRNIAYRLYLRADKFKKRHKKAIVMKNNWKIKYLKLYEKYKKLKEVYEFSRHLP
jgi:hypothetical protein